MRSLIMLAAGFLCSAASVLNGTPGLAADGTDAKHVDKNPGHLRMALVNMKCLYSDTTDHEANHANIRANLKRHCDFVDRLAPDGVEFVGFPELSINGYSFSPNMTWLSLDGPEVDVLRKKAVEKGMYISAGIAEQDAAGKRWNTQFILGPDGKTVGWHHKLWLTKETGFTEAGTDHNVMEVKGAKIGISICADGTDFANLKALADAGAQIIYGPHANTTGGTIAKWYKFREKWGGTWDGQYTMVKRGKTGPETKRLSQNPGRGPSEPAASDSSETGTKMPSGGWIAQLKVYATLHNHAALYNPDYNPPAGTQPKANFASGAWFIGPDGKTLAQMPSSTDRSDSKEFVLIYNVPIAGR